MLRRFLGDGPDCGPWEWDDFVSVRAEPELEPYRQRLLKEVHPFLGQEQKRAEIARSLREVISDLEPAA
jgi:hypothetical protein